MYIPVVDIMDIALCILLPRVSICMTAWTISSRINGINFKLHAHWRLFCQSKLKFRYMKYVHFYLISRRAFITFDISAFSQELEK